MRKCALYFDIENNGLLQNWYGLRVWCNPPYSNTGEWVKKGFESNCDSTFLVNAKTDTKWFHDYVLERAYYIYFFKGRIKFLHHGNPAKGCGRSPSMLFHFPREERKAPYPIFLTLDSKDGL